MLTEKRYFYEGMDGDTSLRLLSDKVALNIMNARLGVTEHGRNGRVENIPGTTLISQSVYPPYGTHQCIGSVTDTARNRLLYFLWNSFGDHGIYCLDYSSPTLPVIYAVMYDSQVVGGLGFSKTSRINRNTRVNGNLLYWTDDLNQPKRINIEAGIKMNHPSYVTDVARYEWPMNPEVITLIRKPPNYPVVYTKKLASDVGITINTNQVGNNSFRFTWYYIYKDGEQSTCAPHSLLVYYNYPDENYDLVELRAPLTEKVDQDVQKVVLAVIYAGEEVAYDIKVWDKESATDLAEIQAHNAGSSPLKYYFTNSEVGSSIDSVTLSKPFDVVPLLSKTLELANSRLFLGNNLMGYDTPLKTSLSAEVIQQSSGSSTSNGSWMRVRIRYDGAPPEIDPGGEFFVDFYFAYFPTAIDDTHPAGYYDLTGDPPLQLTPPFPSSPIDINDYTYIGADVQLDVFYYIASNYDPGYLPYGMYYDSETPQESISSDGTLSDPTTPILKTGSARKLAIVFYDKYMRQCGVVPCPDGLITIPQRTYVFSTTYSYAIQWELSNADALAEIPDWAYYYSIVATKDLTRNFFMQAKGQIKYATKDADGLYEFTSDTYSEDNAGVGIKLNYLQGMGMGYTFNEGDIIRVMTLDGSTQQSQNLSVIGVQGDWLIAENFDFGSLTGLLVIFEIFTPASPAASQFYFEQGYIYSVANPTAANRTYSTTQGTLAGDIYLLTREWTVDYVTENMSPNDTYWKHWYTNAGRIQILDRIGQQRVKTSVRWSNTFIAGTRTNGLSSFDAIDQKILQPELNEINKLQLATKVEDQGQGNVMLAICTTETASLYIGEVQLMAAARAGNVATSDSVIGTVNVLKGSYGTINPESVVEYLGLVFWIDALNGCAVQYSSSGLVPVSRYKQTRFFKRYLSGYYQANSNNLDNINGFHHLPTCVDPFHKEFISTLPALIYGNYASTLPSYSSIPSYATSILNRFDIYDQLGKTMAFSFEENKWGNNYEFMGEWYDYLQNNMFGFKNGQPYVHNSDTVNWNRFYGTNYPVRICFTGNMNPSAIKDLFNISIEGNEAPDFTVAMAQYPNIQITDLAASDYTDQEGVFYAYFLRDRLSPNASGTADQRLYTGDVLKDVALQVMLEFQKYDSLLYINAVNIGYGISRGQQQIINPINS